MSWKDKFPKENRYFETENGILYNGDSAEILSGFPKQIIDTMITDPPYGLKFMGKKWDYDVPSVQLWEIALSVLKPGATAFIFAGSRTQHRMAVNVEDAGFILKDTLMWLYGSGFPKAQDISKMIDKKLCAKRKIIGKKKTHDIRGNALMEATDPKYKKEISTMTYYYTAAATPQAKKWRGYKTHGLKPAYEPIIMAMKPNEGSYVDNALKWRVAGLNIDAGRIGARGGVKKVNIKRNSGGFQGKGFGCDGELEQLNKGRYPANILLDEEAARLLDQQSGVSVSKRTKVNNKGSIWGGGNSDTDIRGYNDKGGNSRFFYVAKASKKERQIGLSKKYEIDNSDKYNGKFPNSKADKLKNVHPTVKPIKLIEYLVKLSSMPNSNQMYIDPFLGSGTTAMACEKSNKKWIGIELNPEYCEIAKQRILAATKQSKLI